MLVKIVGHKILWQLEIQRYNKYIPLKKKKRLELKDSSAGVQAWLLDLRFPGSHTESQIWWLICIPSAGEVETGGSLEHTSQLVLPIWAPGSMRDLSQKPRWTVPEKWHPRLTLCMHRTRVYMSIPVLHTRTDCQLWGDGQHESFLLCGLCYTPAQWLGGGWNFHPFPALSGNGLGKQRFCPGVHWNLITHHTPTCCPHCHCTSSVLGNPTNTLSIKYMHIDREVFKNQNASNSS